MQTQDLLNVFDRASEGAFVISQTGTIIGWNEAAQHVLGYARHQVLGRPCFDVFQPPPSVPTKCRPDCAILKAIADGRPIHEHKLVAQRRDGATLHLSCSSVLLPLGEHARGAVIIFRPEQSAAAEPAAPGDVSVTVPLLSLAVRCFGGFDVLLGGSPVAEGPLWRPRVRALFKHLILSRHQPLPRSVLIERLWPGADEFVGRRNLKVLVHELNQAWEATLSSLGHEPQPLVAHSDGSYFLSPQVEMRVDVEQFQEAWLMGRRLEERGEPDRALVAYLQARDLYQGDYLAADVYEDWSVAARERLQEVYLDLSRRTARLLSEDGALDESIRHCREALAVDPCREDLHRDLMGYLARAGRRAEALRQYRVCRSVLWRELEAAPSSETEAVYQDILRGDRSKANGDRIPALKKE